MAERPAIAWRSAGSGPVTGARVIRLGVIADTHGLFDPAIDEHFAGVEAILHAGDIGHPGVIEQLQRIAPVTAVSGNIDDYERSGFPRKVVFRRGGVKLAICHVLYDHGKMTKEAEAWLDRERPAACLFGHSHRPTLEQYGPTLLFNPGSAGPRRFSLPRGIGILSIRQGNITASLIRLADRSVRATGPIGMHHNK
jgi:uncharacterized protein